LLVLCRGLFRGLKPDAEAEQEHDNFTRLGCTGAFSQRRRIIFVKQLKKYEISDKRSFRRHGPARSWQDCVNLTLPAFPMNQNQSTARRHSAKYQQGFVALSDEVRTHVDTACAAYHLGRQPQTLRAWASFENGPIKPTRIHHRLAWAVKDIVKLLGT
jgi:hypothetical protein